MFRIMKTWTALLLAVIVVFSASSIGAQAAVYEAEPVENHLESEFCAEAADSLESGVLDCPYCFGPGIILQ